VPAPPAPGRIARLLPSAEKRDGKPLAPALARIALGAIRRRVLRATTARVEIGDRGVFLVVDLDTGQGLHIYRHGWNDDVAGALDALLRPGDVVVDGGANLGAFTLVAASIVGPGGTVHAVEAAPATAALLRGSVEANPRLDIRVYELALADAAGELEFTTFEPGLGTASFAPEGKGSVVRVAVTTLDALTEPLDRVDLVKLDIEGAELRALQGAPRLLSGPRPLIVIELEPGHLARQGASAADIESLLTGVGYEGFDIVAEGGRTRFSPLRSPWARPAGNPNILLVPPERRDRLEGNLL
jgi:FkbM family methyltransferase